ncbi:MAG: hypothetical protein FIA92_13540 [Chloroflexi bacterium]|nr:hypothetical protein [Chloroflexota bacterium]
MSDRLAAGVIGHNIVIDCGTHERAMELVEQVRIGPQPLDVERLHRILSERYAWVPVKNNDWHAQAAAIAAAYEADR